MKKASITQATNRLSALIDAVRHGESVLITDRDKPVARLEPVATGGSEEPAAYLNQLQRTGLLRVGSTKPSRVILDKRPPKAATGASVVRALLGSREEDR